MPSGDGEGLVKVGGGVRVRVEHMENVTVVPITWSLKKSESLLSLGLPRGL